MFTTTLAAVVAVVAGNLEERSVGPIVGSIVAVSGFLVAVLLAVALVRYRHTKVKEPKKILLLAYYGSSRSLHEVVVRLAQLLEKHVSYEIKISRYCTDTPLGNLASADCVILVHSSKGLSSDSSLANSDQTLSLVASVDTQTLSAVSVILAAKAQYCFRLYHVCFDRFPLSPSTEETIVRCCGCCGSRMYRLLGDVNSLFVLVSGHVVPIDESNLTESIEGQALREAINDFENDEDEDSGISGVTGTDHPSNEDLSSDSSDSEPASSLVASVDPQTVPAISRKRFISQSFYDLLGHPFVMLSHLTSSVPAYIHVLSQQLPELMQYNKEYDNSSGSDV
jgi:hypothetical protein